MGSNIEKSNINIAKLEEKKFIGYQKLFLYFWGSNDILVDCNFLTTNLGSCLGITSSFGSSSSTKIFLATQHLNKTKNSYLGKNIEVKKTL